METFMLALWKSLGVISGEDDRRDATCEYDLHKPVQVSVYVFFTSVNNSNIVNNVCTTDTFIWSQFRTYSYGMLSNRTQEKEFRDSRKCVHVLYL